MDNNVYMVFAGESYYPAPDDWYSCETTLEQAIKIGRDLMSNGDLNIDWFAIYTPEGPVKFEGSCYGNPFWEEE